MVNNTVLTLFNKINLNTCYLCKNLTSTQSCLCACCTQELQRYGHHCLMCGVQTSQTVARCGRCLMQEPPYQRVVAACAFREPVVSMIYSGKNQANFSLLAALTEQLSACILDYYERHACSIPGVLIPVPLHPRRHRARGFNQAGFIAQTLAQQIPEVSTRLNFAKRITDTVSQKNLNKTERAANIKNAFCIDADAERFDHVAIIDDVMTTGATAHALATVLRQHGVRQVDVWCIARA